MPKPHYTPIASSSDGPTTAPPTFVYPTPRTGEPCPMGVGNSLWRDGRRRTPPTPPGEYPRGIE